MHTKTRHYWLFITITIIANIGIFSFVSKSLETVVANYITDQALESMKNK